MEERQAITVEIEVRAQIEKVWDSWTNPEHIIHWYFASDDWEVTHVESEVRVGGHFLITMAAKDRSASFDFTGAYTDVDRHHNLEYDISDGRHVRITFEELQDAIVITETFDMEHENSEEKQREGWQAILDNFKKYVESS